jgi:hypothetical protein
MATPIPNKLQSNLIPVGKTPCGLPHPKGLIMPTKQNNDDLPDDGYIYMNWLTTAQASEKLGITRQAIIAAIKRWTGDPNDPLAMRGVKLGTTRRGEWRVEPESVERYKRRYKDSN